jgi:hypothetical protein
MDGTELTKSLLPFISKEVESAGLQDPTTGKAFTDPLHWLFSGPAGGRAPSPTGITPGPNLAQLLGITPPAQPRRFMGQSY